MDVEVDPMLKNVLGKLGKYQYLQLALLMTTVIELPVHLVSQVYIAYRPEYHCSHEGTYETRSIFHGLNKSSVINLTFIDHECNFDVSYATHNLSNETYSNTLACRGYQYSIPTDRTSVTEWNLVCNDAASSELATTMLIIGNMVGSAVFTPLSDRYGRKPIIISTHTGYFLLALIMTFSSNITIFSLLRFLMGALQGGLMLANVALYIELVPPDSRHIAEALSTTAWTTGVTLTTLIGYFFRNISWRYMQLTLAMLSVHAIFHFWLLDESLRWLLANGKLKRAEALIKKVAKMNGLDCNDTSTNALVAEQDTISTVTGTSNKVQRYSIFTIFKHRFLLVSSIIIWFIWFTNALTYYGLLWTTSDLSGDRFLNNILAALSEYPAVIIQFILVNRIGRRKVLLIFHSVASVALVTATVCTIYRDNDTWIPTLGTFMSIIGRFAISGSFSTVFLYTPELYPTNMRNVGLGCASVFARLGSMLAPFSTILAYHVSWLPATIFGVMNIIVTLLLLAEPETMHRELPSTLKEMKVWYRHTK